jgi:hypothetical protein
MIPIINSSLSHQSASRACADAARLAKLNANAFPHDQEVAPAEQMSRHTTEMIGISAKCSVALWFCKLYDHITTSIFPASMQDRRTGDARGAI